MFSLIITIISIALVAALALATLYFGGDAFNEGSAKAAASTVVNQASQISGANTLYFLDNQADAADVATLVTDSYLASAPNDGEIATGSYAMSGSRVVLDGVKTSVCDAINTQSGHTQGTVADVDAAVTAMTDAQFGCDLVGAAGSEVATFVFK